MSGRWRITVDSWITDEADWYGRRVFVLDGSTVHSLRAVLRALASAAPEKLLDKSKLTIRRGRPPKINYPKEVNT